MKILSMTATFGKLDHETLTLEPGLNVIHAPNEWGKSTWCAFLMAMLYGVETRGKSTKSALADKERFAPWSGKPMSGRIELIWKGQDITIERSTSGRIPLGQFRAYETATGLPITELNAANCGQQLLGVEQSVFRRAGYIRLNDLPVTQDEALRRRLNELVTTGDESGDGGRLEAGLRELKNRCRLNRRTGLLPQAQQRREEIQSALEELNTLSSQQAALTNKIKENEAFQAQLVNHTAALEYAQAQQDQRRVKEAAAALQEAQLALDNLRSRCSSIPSEAELREEAQKLENLQQELIRVNGEIKRLPPEPQSPVLPPPFQGMNTDDILPMVQKDCRSMKHAAKNLYLIPLCLGAAAILAGSVLLRTNQGLSFVLLSAGLALCALSALTGVGHRSIRTTLTQKYGSGEPAQWLDTASQYLQQHARYQESMAVYRQYAASLDNRQAALNQKYETLCADSSLEDQLNQLNHKLRLQAARATAERSVQTSMAQYEAIQAMARPASAPAQPDVLQYSQEETRTLLLNAQQEHRHLVNRAGVYAGRMEALGSPAALRQELDTLNCRIQRLEDTYSALCIAQQALSDASAQLQRRFAPRITRRAQKLFSEMTEGRYDRLKLGEDFGLEAAARQEDTLREVLWRSDGTVDQLYLSLRLAVAEELTPEAPLIMDDVLVRFDDHRLNAAMGILSQLAENKQIILFTCQSREEEFIHR